MAKELEVVDEYTTAFLKAKMEIAELNRVQIESV